MVSSVRGRKAGGNAEDDEFVFQAMCSVFLTLIQVAMWGKQQNFVGAKMDVPSCTLHVDAQSSSIPYSQKVQTTQMASSDK